MSTLARRLLSVAAPLALALAGCPGGTSSSSGTPPGPGPGPGPGPAPTLVADEAVEVIAVGPDGHTYLGGRFTRIGPATGHAAIVDVASGAVTATSPLLDGLSWDPVVHAAAPDGAGGWYVAGAFGIGPGAGTSTLVRVRADGSFDPAFATSFDGAVNALAVGPDVVYAAGAFGHVDAAVRTRLAAVDRATGRVTAWNPAGGIPALAAATSEARALALGSGRIYAGGDWNAGTGAQGWLAAIDPAGVASAWSPSVSSPVRALAVRDGTLYAGGDFWQIAGSPHEGIAAFDPAGVLSAWNPAMGSVRALAVLGQTLYAGGTFSGIGAEPNARLAAFDPGGALDPWDPGLDSYVNALAVDGGTLYVGGYFQSAGGVRRERLAAFDAHGALRPWSPHANAEVCALAASGGKVLAGGSFTSVGAAVRNHAASLDASGRLTAWDPDVQNTLTCGSGACTYVTGIAFVDGLVHLAGQFTSVGGSRIANLVALDAAGHVVAGRTPSADGAVWGLAALGGRLFVSGEFTHLGGLPRAGLAAFDPTPAASVLDFAPALVGSTSSYGPATISRIVASPTALYVGGQFDEIAGAARRNAAAFDASGALLPWDPSAADTADTRSGVTAIAPHGATVYLAGEFTTLRGERRRGLAEVDAATGAPTAWDPARGDAWFNAWALLPLDGAVYVGGTFVTLGGVPRGHLGAVDAATGAVRAWDPRPNGNVFTLGANGGRILVGGVFDSVGGVPLQGFAALAP
jgi:hypothetical protein